MQQDAPAVYELIAKCKLCLTMQGPAAPAPDLDIATLLATFPPDVREEVLMTSDQTMLASLTPALLAEAQVKSVSA